MSQQPKIIVNARIPLLELATVAKYYKEFLGAENKTDVLKLSLVELSRILVQTHKTELVETVEEAYDVLDSLGKISRRNHDEYLKALEKQDLSETERYKQILENRLTNLKKENQNGSQDQH